MLFSAFGLEGEADASKPPPGTVPEKPAGKRVLIVESDVETSDRLSSLLEAEGYVTSLAADAKNALLLLNDFQPNLVLLGTYLSDMPGYELTQILRGAPQYAWRFKQTGLLYVADRHKLLKHRLIGAPDVPLAQYVFKPIDPNELREKVRKAFIEESA